MLDYQTLSRQELAQMRREIDKAIAAVGDRDKRRALKAAEAAAREHGFSLEELAPMIGTGRGRGSSGAKEPAPVRYRNPENPEQTWSGRGRRPRWVHEAEANGRSLAEMEVSGR